MLGKPVGAAFPAWVRPVQLLGGVAICYLLAKRRDPAAAVLAALAFRVLLEPGAWPAYSSSLIAIALLLQSSRGLAIALAAGSWVFAYTYPLNAVEGIARALLLTGVLLVAVNPELRSFVVRPRLGRRPESRGRGLVGVRAPEPSTYSGGRLG